MISIQITYLFICNILIIVHLVERVKYASKKKIESYHNVLFGHLSGSRRTVYQLRQKIFKPIFFIIYLYIKFLFKIKSSSFY